MTDHIAAARAMIEPLTGYTPGPWKAWQPRHDESVPVRTDGLGITIAYAHQGAVTHAGNNARLMAAAPALRDMVATLADALEAERAKVAAAYEAAAEVYWDGFPAWDTFSAAREAIRALTPADAEAALQRALDTAWDNAIEAAARVQEISYRRGVLSEKHADIIRTLKNPEASHE